MIPLVYEIKLLETSKRILRVLEDLEKTLKEILEELRKLNANCINIGKCEQIRI